MIGCGASFCGALLGHFWRVAISVTRVTCSGGRWVVALGAWFGGGFWGQSVVGLVSRLTMRAPHQVLLLCGSWWGY